MKTNFRPYAPEFAPVNFLDECRELQEDISNAKNPSLQDAIGQQACMILKGRANFFGTPRIIIKASGAFVISSINKSKLSIEFPEVTAKGSIGDVEYGCIKQVPFLALPIFNAQVLNVEDIEREALLDEVEEDPKILDTIMPGDRPLKLPIHFPIPMVEFAVCASSNEPYRSSERVINQSFYSTFDTELALLLNSQEN